LKLRKGSNKELEMFSKKLAGFLAVAGLFLSGSAFAQTIVGSAHDFSQAGAFNDGGEICIACHTTHTADTTVSLAPLWNHEVSTADFTATLYDSATLTATDVSNPTGISRLCLSCHDGTVALDSFGGATGSVFIDAAFNVNDGANGLSNDHPISFTYNDALAGSDGELFTPSDTSSGIPGGSFIANDLLFGASNDQLECASCHDVHNSLGNTSLLVVDNAGSDLCLTCHSK